MGVVPRLVAVLLAALLPLSFVASPASADPVPGLPGVPAVPTLPSVPTLPYVPDSEVLPGVRVDNPGENSDFPRLPPQCYDKNDIITSPCRVTTYPRRPWLVLWGDSHAQMYLPAVRKVAKRTKVNLVAVLFGGCPIAVPFPRSEGLPRTGCDNHNVASLEYVRRLVASKSRVRLLVNGFWSGYRHAYELMQEEERTGIPSGLSDYRKHMARLGVERSRPMFGRIGKLGAPVDMVDQAATVPLDPRTCVAGREPYQCDLPRRRAHVRRGRQRAVGAPQPDEQAPRHASRSSTRRRPTAPGRPASPTSGRREHLLRRHPPRRRADRHHGRATSSRPSRRC